MKKAALKTAGISMDGFRSKSPSIPPEAAPDAPPALERVRRPYTGIGLTTMQANVSHELADARQKLAQFEGASIVRALDPAIVRRSRYANRIADEFKTEEFKRLKDEIASAGGNVQPIKVRTISTPEVIDGQSQVYEIAFGHRRHQACLELGLRVNAIVDDTMTDTSLFEAMDRENRSRKNLSAWEQGRMYLEAINQRLYASERRLSEALGANQSDVNRSIKLAKLPKDVVAAFASPLDLQVRWQKPLTDALQSDPDGIITRARELAKSRGGRTAAQVFDRLVAKPEKQPPPASIGISLGKQEVGTVKYADGGAVTIELLPGVVPEADRPELVACIRTFLAGRATTLGKTS